MPSPSTFFEQDRSEHEYDEAHEIIAETNHPPHCSTPKTAKHKQGRQPIHSPGHDGDVKNEIFVEPAVCVSTRDDVLVFDWVTKI